MHLFRISELSLFAITFIEFNMFPKENMSGDGKELPLSDLPSNRDVIQFAKLLVSRRESPRKNEKI